MKERKTKTFKERLVEKVGLKIVETNYEGNQDFRANDGRWDDVEWVNQQAEISACEDLLGKVAE